MILKQTLYIMLITCSGILARQLSDYEYLKIDAKKQNIQSNDGRVQCALKIVRKYISCGKTVSAIGGDGLFDNLIKTLNNENCYALITRSIKSQRWLLPTDVYLIIVNNSSEVTLSLFELSKDLFWNPGRLFIVSMDKIINENLNQIFNEFLKLGIYNIAVLSFVDSNNISILTYFPFANHNCGKHFDEIVNLGYCSDVVENDLIFRDDYLNEYRGCSVAVGVNEKLPYATRNNNSNLIVPDGYKVGIEQLVLENIAILEGINIEYIFYSNNVYYGLVLPNGSTTGILGHLHNGDISIALGGYILLLNRMEIFDFIWGYNYVEFNIVTRTATEIGWTLIYKEFGIRCWAFIVISFLIMASITLSIMKFFSQETVDSISTILKLLEYFLDHSDERLFRSRNLRLLLLCWIWYTYFISSFYKTAFYSLITGHVKEQRDFNSYQLNKLPLQPCISDDTRSFFINAFNLTFPYEKFIKECQSDKSSLAYVAERDDLYTFATQYSYFKNRFKYVDKDGSFKLDHWDILSDTTSAFYCSRGFVLRKRFQTHAMHIFESGIVNYHLDMMKAKKRQFKHKNRRYFKTLNFSDFRVYYFILLIGSLISLFCFLLEL